jgi:hypothetical protein
MRISFLGDSIISKRPLRRYEAQHEQHEQNVSNHVPLIPCFHAQHFRNCGHLARELTLAIARGQSYTYSSRKSRPVLARSNLLEGRRKS